MDVTYSHVVNTILFKYFVSLAVHEQLDIHLMDITTAYLYENFDNDIYIKIPEEFNMLKACKSNPREIYSIKLERSVDICGITVSVNI